MGLGELLEDGAEDGELGLEGLGVGGAEGGAVGGVVGGGEAVTVEGGDADAFAGHGDFVRDNVDVGELKLELELRLEMECGMTCVG